MTKCYTVEVAFYDSWSCARVTVPDVASPEEAMRRAIERVDDGDEQCRRPSPKTCMRSFDPGRSFITAWVEGTGDPWGGSTSIPDEFAAPGESALEAAAPKLRDALAALLEWEAQQGGYEAPAWATARTLLNELREPARPLTPSQQ